VRHWTRLLADERDDDERSRMLRSRAVNALGCAVTGTVLVVVLVTKFLSGAWIAVLAMAVLFLTMRGIQRHYDRLAADLEIDDVDGGLPSRVHAIVLVSKLHKPAMRALSYARASRSNVVEAVTVDVDPEATARLLAEWEERSMPLQLRVLSSPYREVIRPIVSYVNNIRRNSPRDVVTVYIPEYVVGHWWEHLLHNQTALILRSRLLLSPGTMVTSVPYQLQSAAAARQRADRVQSMPGDIRGRWPGGAPPPQSPSESAAQSGAQSGAQARAQARAKARASSRPGSPKSPPSSRTRR
jgi:hypothetical protein